MNVACLCGGEAAPLIQAGRHTSFVFQNHISRLHVCERCTHVFCFPAPTESQLADFYNGSWNEGSNYSIDFCYAAWIDDLQKEIHKPKATFVDTIMRLRRKHFKRIPQIVVHDASCGYGALVSKLNMIGFDATGSDISGESIELARRRDNNHVYRGHFSEIPNLLSGGGADMLTCYHAVEHYRDPLEFFHIVKRSLRPNGLFVMSVPNGNYLPAQVDYFGKFDWCFYPGHLQYFTPRSAEVLLAKAGLRLIEAFSYDWDASQEDWLLNTAARLPTFRPVARGRLLRRLAAKTVTRDLRVVAINEDNRSRISLQRLIRPASLLLSGRARTKILQLPRLDSEIALVSDATCNEFVDDGVSVLRYQIWRRDSEYFLSMRFSTNHTVIADYVMVLHLEDFDSDGESFVNLDFPPCPPTTEWRPHDVVTIVRQLLCPATVEFRPEMAVNVVHQPPLPPGKYAIRVGLWDLEKGLVGRLARLGPVMLPGR